MVQITLIALIVLIALIALITLYCIDFPDCPDCLLAMWSICGFNVVAIIIYVVATWLICVCYMVAMWLLWGCNVVDMWLLCSFYVVAIGIHFDPLGSNGINWNPLGFIRVP